MSKKKTIIWQAHEANISGANIAMLEYVKALRDTYTFHIVLPHAGTMCETLSKEDIAFSIIHQYNLTIPITTIFSRVRFFLRTQMASYNLRTLIKRKGADLIFTNTLVSFLCARVAYSLRIPHVWWIHEFGEEDFGLDIQNGPVKDIFKKMDLWSRFIICNSDAVAKKFKILMPKAQVRYLYQPVSFEVTNKKNVEKLSSFLMFGQIAPGKGHHEVLQALNMVKKRGTNLTLHIIGPCENQLYLNELSQYINQHDLEEQVVIKIGFFSKEDVLPFYRTLIVASKSEAFGRVIVEANKAGLTVIVKNAGGAPELINNTNGFLYNTALELANLISAGLLLPASQMRFNYDENREVDKLKVWITEML